MNQKLNPETEIPNTGGRTMLDYWSWAFSDIMGNTERGVFAEYLVATALGINNIPRRNWLPYDLLYKNAIRIEVKASAYIKERINEGMTGV